MNNWKQIWNNRKDTLDTVDANDFRAVFVELKRISGYGSAELTPTLVE